MKLDDFDFELPEELIAVRPMADRQAGRLLVSRADGLQDCVVADLAELLGPSDLLVINNTKVIPARLFGHRDRESNVSKIEVTLLNPTPEGGWRALIKPLRKVKDGEQIVFAAGLVATLEGRDEGQGILRFNLEGARFDAALEEAGQMPLPPYIAAKRAADARDKEDYQTRFAKHAGAVAAPTASLHFDDALLAALRAKGVGFAEVTLHVGAGTFLPVKVEDVTTHKMHAEWGQITPEAAEQIARAKRTGGRVIPVGTTALRLIETAAQEGGEISAWTGETDIFIYPGFDFKVTDALITNFHLPKSTLLMLVSALIGEERVKAAYAHAVTERYRFFSYGDASLLIP